MNVRTALAWPETFDGFVGNTIPETWHFKVGHAEPEYAASKCPNGY